MNIPRLVLAGTHSGVGKTTITLGLLAALRKRGYRVQAFKVGPDYIDPSLHRVAAGKESHNLDAWMGTEDIVKEVFCRNAADCDIAVIEGVMGLFDGLKNSDRGSTAHISWLLQAPVTLVVNARGMARSCGAIVKGYRDFDFRVNIAGVIFNNVGGPRHVSSLKTVVENEVGLPVLGTLKRRSGLIMPERHLGLLPASEYEGIKDLVEELASVVEEDVDLIRLLDVASQAPHLKNYYKPYNQDQKIKVKLAVAMDEAFNFYYRDSLDYLEELGAKLVCFSPLHNKTIPSDVQGLYIGGGFPEMFLPQLAKNKAMKNSIRYAHNCGIPIYAECGGLMYMMEKIQDFCGSTYEGVGLIPGTVKMQKKLAALGYVKAVATRESILANPGDELKGHEFHCSVLLNRQDSTASYKLYGGKGEDGRLEGFVERNLLASYVHLHFRSNPVAAKKFLQVCAGGAF